MDKKEKSEPKATETVETEFQQAREKIMNEVEVAEEPTESSDAGEEEKPSESSTEEEPPPSEPSDGTPETKPDESETEGDSEPAEETAPPIELSDAELDAEIQSKKDNVQKRIDKITAQKKAAESEVETLRKQVETLSQKVDGKSTATPKYTDEQLKAALAKAMADGNHDLQFEVYSHMVKREREDAVAEINRQDTAQQNLAQQEKQVWSSVVENYSTITDPDFNVNDPNSKLMVVAKKLLTDTTTGPRYAEMGPVKFYVVTKDAENLILNARLKKQTNKKTKSLEKQLVREKKKTRVTSGKSTPSQSAKPKGSTDPVSEAFDDRMKLFDAARSREAV